MEGVQTQTTTQHNPFYSPMNQYGSAILTLTNPESDLYKMELTLRSCILDKEGNTRPAGDPLMNEKGITSVLGQVQSIVSQTAIMSNFNKTDIPVLMDFLNDSLTQDLMMNSENYEIKDEGARTKIYFMIMTAAFVCLKRGYEEGDRRFWKGNQPMESRVFVDGQGQQKKGLFSLFGWGNKK